MRISDWSSDVCSSDLADLILPPGTMVPFLLTPLTAAFLHGGVLHLIFNLVVLLYIGRQLEAPLGSRAMAVLLGTGAYAGALAHWLADPQSNVPMIGASGAISALIAVFALRSEEHTSELQSLMRISYAVFCLKK